MTKIAAFSRLLVLQKNLDLTCSTGSEHASVITNLISTLATQLYSKTTKINKIFVGTPHFSLKLIQKDKFMSKSHIHRPSGLYLMSLMHKTEFLSILNPGHVTQKWWVLTYCKFYSCWRGFGGTSQIIIKIIDFWKDFLGFSQCNDV